MIKAEKHIDKTVLGVKIEETEIVAATNRESMTPFGLICINEIYTR